MPILQSPFPHEYCVEHCLCSKNASKPQKHSAVLKTIFYPVATCHNMQSAGFDAYLSKTAGTLYLWPGMLSAESGAFR